MALIDDDPNLTGLPHYIGDEDHPLTTWPTYGGIRRESFKPGDHMMIGWNSKTEEVEVKTVNIYPPEPQIDEPTVEEINLRNSCVLANQQRRIESTPPASKTYSREVGGKLLPIQRAQPKRIAGESGRQRRLRLKQERRELRGDE